MTRQWGEKEKRILEKIRDNPFITQQELAKDLGLSRSAVAGYISQLTRQGEILGRAYLLPERERIICIGGANLDRKAKTSAPVEWGTSNPVEVRQTFGGVARNIAENLAQLEMDVALMTIVGQDREGEALLTECRRQGMDVSLSTALADYRTGSYTAVLDPAGEMVLALADMGIYDQMDKAFIHRYWSRIRTSYMVVTDTNLSKEGLKALLQRCRKDGLFLCVVPVSAPKARRLPPDLEGVSLWIGNGEELEAVSGISVQDRDSGESACRRLREKGVDRVVWTRGAHGVYWVEEEKKGWLKGTRTSVVDVTGAGDAFAAGVVAGLKKGRSLESACRVGLKLAARTVQTEASVSEEIIPNWLEEGREEKL
ncbi:carbohydrate kinase [Desmospora profundinema]|uniref:Pseudouridine kinase n=1 Tax=Desmospora profundinema TaxID=1571184 RepID=A0ABU1IJY4_9BACL|nr:carbohydrate kinase [Desmospora profundinema]MDR6225092.1 pseudouridine kinase [Desmospora profundinema]